MQNRKALMALLIFVLIICLFFVDKLALDRTLEFPSQSWRWLTAHITHFNSRHLLINLAGLFFILAVNDRFLLSKSGLFSFVFISLWVSGVVWVLDVGTVRYAGLSGVLHGLIFLAITTSPYYSRRIKTALATAVIFKTVYEQLPVYNNEWLQAFLGTGVANSAHLYGLTAGIFIACFIPIPPSKYELRSHSKPLDLRQNSSQ